MYYQFSGSFLEKSPTYAVIECNGVAYLLHISLNTYTQIQSKTTGKLYAHLQVREDDMSLYGFHSLQERDVFRLLISVSGVGAASARLILSSLTAEEVEQAIVSENLVLLKSVKGVGQKTAQRIILDLKDKISSGASLTVRTDQTTGISARVEAAQALEVLGFSKPMVEKTLAKIMTTNPGISVEELIKQALKSL